MFLLFTASSSPPLTLSTAPSPSPAAVIADDGVCYLTPLRSSDSLSHLLSPWLWNSTAFSPSLMRPSLTFGACSPSTLAKTTEPPQAALASRRYPPSIMFCGMYGPASWPSRWARELPTAHEMGPRASDHAEATWSLANLALDDHRNRWVIVDEGGVPQLLALLKHRDDEASQSAAAAALANLNFDRELISAVTDALAIPAIVQTISKSTSTRL
ncbi:hypothetical protein Cni_G13556 [Canna indica]|uniref:ARM repeat superfamily protein n=1 Tax=Canna indica TaxID=4628 RepID=A0AAQ3KBF3_9LILI|nr:hypothetical protein Cni_G13556 [Canna indica]